jgi:hypothetical protein
MKNFSSKASCALLASALIVLPSCDWLKDKLGLNKNTPVAQESLEGEVIATLNGKPLMTAPEFEKQYKSFIEKHPYGAMFAQMEGIDRKIFDGLVSQKIMTHWVDENNIKETPEYKEYLEQLIQMLNARFFQLKHPVTVPESELKAFYDKNKESMPEAIVSRGGVNATGVSFAKEADAKAFAEKAKGKGATLEALAKESNLADKYRDFKLVNASSIGIDPVLRDKIITKKSGSVDVIKGGDNTYYVVYIANKEEPKYRSFEELKPAIEQRLTAQKQEEAMEKAMEQLKKDYKVEIKEEYFTKKNDQAGKEVINDEQLEMVMPELPADEVAHAKPHSSAKVA